MRRPADQIAAEPEYAHSMPTGNNYPILNQLLEGKSDKGGHFIPFTFT